MLINQKHSKYKLENVHKNYHLTNKAGLIVFRQIFESLGINQCFQNIALKQAGYSDSIVLESLVLNLIAGGEHLTDWESFREDQAFKKL